MPDLLAARSQVALSLGFHIQLVMGGIAMPAPGQASLIRWGWARLAGGLVLSPSLVYLLRVFEREPARR
jgi:hypothetical protein